MGTIRKEVTEKEIESGRIGFPAMARDRYLPDVAGNSQTPVTLEDENGDTHDIVVKVRDNGTKPEIMAKGGRKFLRKRKISTGDALLFLDEETEDRMIRLKVEKRPHDLPPPGLGAFGFVHAPLVNEPPPPSESTVVFGFDVSMGSDDYHAPMVPYASENLVLELGLSNGSEVELSLSMGSGHAQSINPQQLLPPVVRPELGLSIGSAHAPPINPPPLLHHVMPEFELSMGSGHSRLTLELGLSIGSNHLKSFEPPEAPPTTLSFSAGKTIKRDVKVEAQDGPTLELTLGSLPWSPVLLQDHDQQAVKPSLSDILKDPNVWAKPGSSTQQVEQARHVHGALYLGLAHSDSAYFPSEHEMQEPKPPTSALVPVITQSAEFDFLGALQFRLPPVAMVEDGTADQN